MILCRGYAVGEGGLTATSVAVGSEHCRTSRHQGEALFAGTRDTTDGSQSNRLYARGVEEIQQPSMGEEVFFVCLLERLAFNVPTGGGSVDNVVGIGGDGRSPIEFTELLDGC